MLRFATFNRKLFTTNSRVRARTVDTDQDKCREFIECHCERHKGRAV